MSAAASIPGGGSSADAPSTSATGSVAGHSGCRPLIPVRSAVEVGHVVPPPASSTQDTARRRVRTGSPPGPISGSRSRMPQLGQRQASSVLQRLLAGEPGRLRHPSGVGGDPRGDPFARVDQVAWRACRSRGSRSRSSASSAFGLLHRETRARSRCLHEAGEGRGGRRCGSRRGRGSAHGDRSAPAIIPSAHRRDDVELGVVAHERDLDPPAVPHAPARGR